MGIDAGPVWPLAKRVRDRYEQMTNGAEETMVDFDERDLLELALAAGFERADVELEARIERGAPLWGEVKADWAGIVSVAPNPNATHVDRGVRCRADAGGTRPPRGLPSPAL